MQQLKEGLKELFRKRKELDAQIAHVQKALGIEPEPSVEKTAKKRAKKPKKVDGAQPEGQQAQPRAVKPVDFGPGVRDLVRQGN